MQKSQRKISVKTRSNRLKNASKSPNLIKILN